MQEALLRSAHPVPFGFGPMPIPMGFGDRRLCSPRLLLPVGDARFYGGGGGCYAPFAPSPMASPHGFGGYTLFAPIPTASPLGGGYAPIAPSPTTASPRGTPIPARTTRASPRGDGYTPSPTKASPRGATSPPTASSSASRVDDDAAASAHRMRMSRLVQKYQDVANRYQLCVAQLADAAREAAALRLENSELRAANSHLAGRFFMLGGSQGAAVALSQQLGRLQLGQMQAMPAPPMLPMAHPAPPAVPMLRPMARPASQAPPMLRPMARPASQAPPMLRPMARPASQAPPMLRHMARPASPAEKLAVLPKSISIRSAGYMKLTRNAKHRVTNPLNVGSQRVFVGMDGAKPAEQKRRDREKGQVVKSMGGLEFEAYSQGMFKTELCNKWEETGACTFAGKCQFAHGIAELRPVIRHPRYKTQPCRMLIGGALCPYGHRCHFRHSANPADHQLQLLRA